MTKHSLLPKKLWKIDNPQTDVMEIDFNNLEKAKIGDEYIVDDTYQIFRHYGYDPKENVEVYQRYHRGSPRSHDSLIPGPYGKFYIFQPEN